MIGPQTYQQYKTAQQQSNISEKVANGLAFATRSLPALAVIQFGANALNRGIGIHRSNISYQAAQGDINNTQSFAFYDNAFYDVSNAMTNRASIEDAKSVGTMASPTDVDQPELYADNARQVQLSILSAPPAVLRTARDTFERYGYMINRPMVPQRLDPMTAFSYWQTEDTTVLGNMPAADREQLAAEFQAGLTVWENMAQIGTNPTNSPRTGISY